VFGNPRPAQLKATLDYVVEMPVSDNTVVGGDFNTFLPFEHTTDIMRSWALGQGRDDTRATFGFGRRLDYLFFRLPSGWFGDTKRIDSRFGSDHYPLVGHFR
jgi:endonuclease/exonuclease/phosphatase (EEP) superfamily protein YafD